MTIGWLSFASALSISFPIIAADKLPETGKQFPALVSFDELMRKFVRENNIPGAALAVAKDGRMVYARGFGYADREKKSMFNPNPYSGLLASPNLLRPWPSCSWWKKVN